MHNYSEYFHKTQIRIIEIYDVDVEINTTHHSFSTIFEHILLPKHIHHCWNRFYKLLYQPPHIDFLMNIYCNVRGYYDIEVRMSEIIFSDVIPYKIIYR